MDDTTKLTVLAQSREALSKITAKSQQGANSAEILEELQALRKAVESLTQVSAQPTDPLPQEPSLETKDIILEKAQFVNILEHNPTSLILPAPIEEGEYNLICKDLAGSSIPCKLDQSEVIFATYCKKYYGTHKTSEELLEVLFPGKKRLYLTQAVFEVPSDLVCKMAADGKLSSKIVSAAEKAYAYASVIATKLPNITDQMERLLPLTDKNKTTLKAMPNAVASIKKAMAGALPATDKIPVSTYEDSSIFELTDKLIKLLPKLSKLSNFEKQIKTLKAFLSLKDLREEVTHAKKSENALPALTLPDPEFNVDLLNANKPSGILSRLPRRSCVNKQYFLVNEMEPTQANAACIYAIVTIKDSVGTEDLKGLPKTHLAGIDQFTKKEFSGEKDFYYLEFEQITSYDPPLELKSPPDGDRYGSILKLPEALKKEEGEETEVNKSQDQNIDGLFFCPECGNTKNTEENQDQWCNRCGNNLEAVLKASSKEVSETLEDSNAQSSIEIAKGPSAKAFLEMPQSGDTKYPCAFQLHFRGKTVHGDLRIKTNDDFLIGYTLLLQKSNKVPDIETLDQAKKIADAFDSKGSWWNKDMQGPSTIQTVLKGKHPISWLKINAEAFEPGMVGASTYKPGFLVTEARPNIYFGARAAEFHEWFLEGDSKFHGRMFFRQVGQGDKSYWTASFTKTLLPYVLRKRAITEGKIPPKGFSWLPPALKAAVPKQFKYWLLDKESQRKEVLKALIEEKLFTEENVKVVDNKISKVTTKYEVYSPPEEKEKKDYLSGAAGQLFPSNYASQILAKSVVSMFPKDYSTYCEPFFTNGMYLGHVHASKSGGMINICDANLAKLYSFIVSEGSDTELEAGSWTGSSTNFDLACENPDDKRSLLYKCYFQNQSKQSNQSDLFDRSKSGIYAAVPERIAEIKKQAAEHSFYGIANPLEFIAMCGDSDRPFILIDPPEDATPEFITKSVQAANNANALYLVVTDQVLPGLSTHRIANGEVSRYVGANYQIKKQEPEVNLETIPFYYSLPDLHQDAVFKQFALITHVDEKEDLAYYHLLIQADDDVVEDFYEVENPFEQTKPQVFAQLKLEGSLDDLHDRSDIQIVAEGRLPLVMSTANFKKYESTESTPAFTISNTGEDAAIINNLSKKPFIATQPAFESTPIEEKIQEENEAEGLKLQALFKTMKVLGGDENVFRSSEIARIYKDFATKTALEIGLAVEPKYNGWNVILEKDEDEKICIFSEEIADSKPVPTNYASLWPEVEKALSVVPGPFIIAGEFTAVDHEGGPISKTELSTYCTKQEIKHSQDVRIKVFDIYKDSEGSAIDEAYVARRKRLGKLLKDNHAKQIEIVPMMIVNGKKDLASAIKWARRVVNSEGAMLKSIKHTANLNENTSIAKVKGTRELKGIVYVRHEASPGIYNYQYAVGPVSKGGVSETNSDKWAKTVKVGQKLYVLVGKTFNTKVKANKGDLLSIEVSELLYDKSVHSKHTLRGFASAVVAKSKGKPSTVKEVFDLLELGETKKLASAAQAALGKAIALDDLPLTILQKKTKTEERYIKGVVLIPNIPDAHGDVYDEETVRQAAHHFMANSEALGKQHAFGLSKNKLVILECYLLDATCAIGDQEISKGTWILAARVKDDALWQEVKEGKLTGWSIEGSALAEPLI